MFARSNEQAYVAKSNSCKASNFKHNRKIFKKKNKRLDGALKKEELRHVRILSMLRRIRAS